MAAMGNRAIFNGKDLIVGLELIFLFQKIILKPSVNGFVVNYLMLYQIFPQGIVLASLYWAISLLFEYKRYLINTVFNQTVFMS